MATVDEVTRKCKTALRSHYGSRLQDVILYGSSARNQAEAISDIDLLVLLKQPYEYFTELRQIIEVLYPIQLESKRLISAKPALSEEFDEGAIQLYRNAKREGMRIH